MRPRSSRYLPLSAGRRRAGEVQGDGLVFRKGDGVGDGDRHRRAFSLRDAGGVYGQAKLGGVVVGDGHRGRRRADNQLT